MTFCIVPTPSQVRDGASVASEEVCAHQCVQPKTRRREQETHRRRRALLSLRAGRARTIQCHARRVDVVALRSGGRKISWRIVLDEMRLHVSACARWGVDADYYMASHPPEPAAEKYVKFLESLHEGSMEGLIAGMVPCMRLYSALGSGFAKIGLDACGPYREWFDAYASTEMNALATQLESLLPADVEDLTTEIIDNYKRAMELERDFFEAWVL